MNIEFLKVKVLSIFNDYDFLLKKKQFQVIIKKKKIRT